MGILKRILFWKGEAVVGSSTSFSAPGGWDWKPDRPTEIIAFFFSTSSLLSENLFLPPTNLCYRQCMYSSSFFLHSPIPHVFFFSLNPSTPISSIPGSSKRPWSPPKPSKSTFWYQIWSGFLVFKVDFFFLLLSLGLMLWCVWGYFILAFVVVLFLFWSGWRIEVVGFWGISCFRIKKGIFLNFSAFLWWFVSGFFFTCVFCSCFLIDVVVDYWAFGISWC